MKRALLIVLLCASGCAPQSFKAISKRIKESGTQNASLAVRSHKIRMELYKAGRLDFLKAGADTIWILEGLSLESGSITGRIWSHTGAASYVYLGGKFDPDTNRIFTRYERELIQQWDTAAIKEEERKHGHGFDGLYMYGWRVIKQSHNVRIDHIGFSRFFDFKRDVEY